MLFVAGILVGGFIVSQFLRNPQPIELNAALKQDLQQLGLNNQSGLMPPELFSWKSLTTLRGLMFIVVGGFLVGFGTRYAGGCTSGHSIMGLSNLQWPSLIATICFMVGGIIVANWIVPFLLN